jgi:hypothetical protein
VRHPLHCVIPNYGIPREQPRTTKCILGLIHRLYQLRLPTGMSHLSSEPLSEENLLVAKNVSRSPAQTQGVTQLASPLSFSTELPSYPGLRHLTGAALDYQHTSYSCSAVASFWAGAVHFITLHCTRALQYTLVEGIQGVLL